MSNDPIPVTSKAKGHEFPDIRIEQAAASGYDSDDTTAFAWNPTSLPRAHEFELHVYLHDESVSNNEIRLTLNGVTTADYQWQEASSGTFGSSTGSNFVLADARANHTVTGSVTITGGMHPSDSTKLSVSGPLCNVSDRYTLYTGYLSGNENELRELNLTTEGAATGRAVLIGKKYR